LSEIWDILALWVRRFFGDEDGDGEICDDAVGGDEAGEVLAGPSGLLFKGMSKV
jgi:hypothetical protein